MKKFIYLLLALPLLALTACSDDDDLPDVNLTTEYTGATSVDGVLYVVQGEPFVINSVTATPVREGKKAAVLNVTYGLDGWVVGSSVVAPFTVEFDTSVLELGKHILSLSMNIAEEGCEPAIGYYATTMQVVASADDIPTSSETETQGTFTGHASTQEQ